MPSVVVRRLNSRLGCTRLGVQALSVCLEGGHSRALSVDLVDALLTCNQAVRVAVVDTLEVLCLVAFQY